MLQCRFKIFSQVSTGGVSDQFQNWYFSFEHTRKGITKYKFTVTLVSQWNQLLFEKDN